MMKIRTADQLQEVLDAEFSWRLKEIADIRSAAESAKLGSQKTLIRAGVALLYAHWEGFIKKSTTAYINYVVIPTSATLGIAVVLCGAESKGKDS